MTTRSFRFTVYGVRHDVATDPTTGHAERSFGNVRDGYTWAASVSKYPDNPAYSAHTWNDEEGALWAIRIQPDWSWRFVTC